MNNIVANEDATDTKMITTKYRKTNRTKIYYEIGGKMHTKTQDKSFESEAASTSFKSRMKRF